LLYTVSAVQILGMVDAFHVLEERGMRGGKMGVGRCKFRRRIAGGRVRARLMPGRYCEPPESQNGNLCG
jgi:hypothetical protein